MSGMLNKQMMIRARASLVHSLCGMLLNKENHDYSLLIIDRTIRKYTHTHMVHRRRVTSAGSVRSDESAYITAPR